MTRTRNTLSFLLFCFSWIEVIWRTTFLRSDTRNLKSVPDLHESHEGFSLSGVTQRHISFSSTITTINYGTSSFVPRMRYCVSSVRYSIESPLWLFFMFGVGSVVLCSCHVFLNSILNSVQAVNDHHLTVFTPAYVRLFPKKTIYPHSFHLHFRRFQSFLLTIV